MSVLDTLEIELKANINGADGILNGLAAQLESIPKAALNAQDGMAKAGRNLASSLSDGLKSGAGEVTSSSKMIAGKADFTSAIPKAKSAGSSVASGFASGIRSGTGAVGSAALALANTAIRKLRSALSIHSPSRVTKSLGSYFTEGFALGVTGSIDTAARAAQDLASSAASTLSAGIPSASAGAQDGACESFGSINLTVPLYIDSEKLGEASIRGINAVTKRAGRVLLNI